MQHGIWGAAFINSTMRRMRAGVHISAAFAGRQQSYQIKQQQDQGALPPALLPRFLEDTACRVLALRSGRYTDGSANSIAAIPKGARGDSKSLQDISGCSG